MLDLTLQQNLYEIKWIDGQVLKLKAPTQGLYLEIGRLSKLSDDTDTAIVKVTEITEKILNTNTIGLKISNIDELLSFTTMLTVIKDYFEYYNKKIEDEVPFQASQQAKK